MILTKNKIVLKTLIEASLNKTAATEQQPQCVEFWMAMLRASLSHYKKVFIYGDSPRVAEDFKDALKMDSLIIRSGVNLRGIGGRDQHCVVILHTGVRTEIQSSHYRELMTEICARCNMTVWHVGKWR